MRSRQEDTPMHPLFRGATVIPVLTIERERDAVPLARALAEGGLRIIEVTFRTAAAAAALATELPYLPGVATPSEIMATRALGICVMKLFPAEALGGVALLRALAPVFAGIAFCPTGGIDERSAGDYLALPNVPTVGGSWMAPRDAIASGDWPRICRLAERAAAIGRAEAA